MNLYQQGDKVSYTGEKFKKELGGKLGFVTAGIENQPGVYSVDFPEMKTEDRFYVLAERFLSRFRPSKKEDHDRERQVEIQRRRRRTAEDES